MDLYEERRKERVFAREKKITVKLSDAESDRLAIKCGLHGLTIEEMIENFIGDLVGGTYSNGNDESDAIDQWIERCWFGGISNTLLSHFICSGYDPEEYLDAMGRIETAIDDKAYLEEHPEEANEEAAWIDDDIECDEEFLEEMREGWEPEKEPNMEEEIERIKKWASERNDLRGGRIMENKEPVTRVWRVYGEEELDKSCKCDFSNEQQGVRIIEVENSDITGTNKYMIVRITRNTVDECEHEFWNQYFHGVFKNLKLGGRLEVESR